MGRLPFRVFKFDCFYIKDVCEVSKIDVVIVNWNAGTQLQECVESLTLYGELYVNQIIVVDNGSTDGSELIVEKSPKVTLVRAGQNLGFGKACNIGSTYATGEFLLFLNPDTRVFQDSLSKAAQFIERPQNNRVGVCGIQLIDETGRVTRTCARFPTVIGLIAHATGLDRLIPRIGHFMQEWDHQQTREVDHVIGAFYLLRRQLFNDIRGFDERFFVYFEDLDLSYRLKLQGWSAVYYAGAQAFHAGGGTSRQIKARRLFYSIRSRILYVFAHFSLFGAVAVLFATLFIEPLSRSLFAILRASGKSLQETLTGYGMLYRWLPSWVFRRVTR